MRSYSGIAMGVACFALASVAFAAPKATRTSADVVKAFTPEPDSDSIALGAGEKAFSLGSSTPAAAPAPAGRFKSPAAAPSGQRFSLGASPAAVPHKRAHAASTASAAPTGLDMRVTFNLGSAEMTEQAKAEAKVFADAMQAPQLAGQRFAVEGHTDAIGDRAYNLDLSKRRAQAVVDFLVAQHVDASRLVPNGYGFDKPRPGLDPKAPANRRVEFARAS